MAFYKKAFRALSFFFLILSLGFSQEKNEDKDGPKSEEKKVATSHQVQIGDIKISYEAITGTVHLRDNKDEKTASIFYTAYLRKVDAATRRSRPIFFSFNGGPGSCSVWLHLGALGPRRVAFENAGTTFPKPPYRLVDNRYSLLDKADLVFIDPVSTGFSRPNKPDQAGKFHGVQEDIRSVGEFIRIFLTRENRWGSPKFLIGESYGALRAAGLVDHLQKTYGMYLNGVALLSGLIDYATLLGNGDNDLPHILFLPTMTATAFYHKKLGPELMGRTLQEAVKISEEFAFNQYAVALLQGNQLPENESKSISAELSRLTGLSPDLWQDAYLRLGTTRFRKALLKEEGQIVGRFDSRIVGGDGEPASSRPGFDPSYSIVHGAFASLINDYLRRELEYEDERPYEILKGLNWKFNATNAYTNVAGALTNAMQQNPHLYVHVSCGHYDLATPPTAIVYSINHLELDPPARQRFTIDYYEGGHMMYTNEAALKNLKSDLSKFVGNATSKP